MFNHCWLLLGIYVISVFKWISLMNNNVYLKDNGENVLFQWSGKNLLPFT